MELQRSKPLLARCPALWRAPVLAFFVPYQPRSIGPGRQDLNRLETYCCAVIALDHLQHCVLHHHHEEAVSALRYWPCCSRERYEARLSQLPRRGMRVTQQHSLLWPVQSPGSQRGLQSHLLISPKFGEFFNIAGQRNFVASLIILPHAVPGIAPHVSHSRIIVHRLQLQRDPLSSRLAGAAAVATGNPGAAAGAALGQEAFASCASLIGHANTNLRAPACTSQPAALT